MEVKLRTREEYMQELEDYYPTLLLQARKAVPEDSYRERMIHRSYEDVAHDAVEEYMRAIEDGQHIFEPGAWLYLAMRRNIINDDEKAKRRKRLEGLWDYTIQEVL